MKLLKRDMCGFLCLVVMMLIFSFLLVYVCKKCRVCVNVDVRSVFFFSPRQRREDFYVVRKPFS
jgi:hypothetical protein